MPNLQNVGGNTFAVPAGDWIFGAGPAAQALLPSGGVFSLKEIAFEGRKFVLGRDLEIRVTQEEGGWTFESLEPELIGLIGFGHSRDDAEAAFRQTFAACWDNIAREEDSKLTSRAIAMKRALLALAKET